MVDTMAFLLAMPCVSEILIHLSNSGVNMQQFSKGIFSGALAAAPAQLSMWPRGALTALLLGSSRFHHSCAWSFGDSLHDNRLLCLNVEAPDKDHIFLIHIGNVIPCL